MGLIIRAKLYFNNTSPHRNIPQFINKISSNKVHTSISTKNIYKYKNII